MKNSIMKVMTVVMIVLMIVASANTVFAATDLLDPSTISAEQTDTSDKIGGIMNEILGIVQVVAISIAVIMLIVLGIKYMSAAPAEKADIKKGAMIYVVGALLLFGTTFILGIIKGFVS